MSLLVTAFEPFGDWERNTSALVGEAVADALAARLLVLPVDLATGPQILVDALSPHTAVLALGLHGRARALRVERVGLNLADFEVPDNAGRTVAGQPLERFASRAGVLVVDVAPAICGERGCSGGRNAMGSSA